MDLQEIKEIIQKAHDAVKDEEVESNKFEIFKIVLEKLLEEHMVNAVRQPPAGQPPAGQLQLGMKDLADKCNISVDTLKNVISVHNDLIELLLQDKAFGDTEAKQQVNGSQVVLAAYETIFKSEWVKSSILAPCLKGAGIVDPYSNLAKTLKNHDDIFRKRPNANEYKLTSPKGINSAYEIIKKLSEGGKT